MSLVAWLHELDKSDAATVGATAANLGELAQYGLPVPEGFVVTPLAWQAFANTNRLTPLVARLTKNLRPADTSAINRASDEITAAISNGVLGEGLEQAITDAYHRLSQRDGGESLISLRVSSLDRPSLVFLNLNSLPAVVAALKQLYAGHFKPAAIYQRLIQGSDDTNPNFAVVAQRLVYPKTAGRLVTAHPHQMRDDTALIEAIWGLSQPVITGNLAPDRYVVAKHREAVIGQTTTPQSWQLGYHRGSNRHIGVPPELVERPKLNPQEILELIRAARQIETASHGPMEVEWAIDYQGNWWLLDARPLALPPALSSGQPHYQSTSSARRPSTAGAVGQVLVAGMPASIGAACGPVQLIHPRASDRLQPGAILVAESLGPAHHEAIRYAAALVSETGGPTCYGAQLARSFNIPCVVGLGQATHRLQTGQIVTVDGMTGRVYQGAVAAEDLQHDHRHAQFLFRNSPQAPITATKVMATVSDPNKYRTAASIPADGALLQPASHHDLAQTIRQAAELFFPRLITVRLSDVLSLQAVNRSRRYLGSPKFSLLLPVVRTVEELKRIKQLIEQDGVEPGDKLWLTVALPATIAMLDQLTGAGVDGIAIDPQTLGQLTLGIDRDATISNHPAVLAATSEAIERAKTIGLPSMVVTDVALPAELLEAAVHAGVSSVAVPPQEVVPTRRLLKSIERRYFLSDPI